MKLNFNFKTLDSARPQYSSWACTTTGSAAGPTSEPPGRGPGRGYFGVMPRPSV
jgi:hypothetical protein